MEFAGFPDEMLTFYEGLEADNSKPYWTDHRSQYDTAVAAPMRALLDALGPEFGEAKFFRPYRDVRFSKDKTPYKTAAGAIVRNEPGEGGLYVQVSADGILVAGGYWSCATDQSRRLREAAADDRLGGQLVALLGELTAAGFEVGGERLKRVPKPAVGFNPRADHPRAELLRAKTLTASRHHAPDDGLHSSVALQRVREGWRAVAPLNHWLADHVGVSRAVPVR